MSLTPALELKTDLLGTLNISGALTGYMFYSNNASDTRKTRYDVGSAIINLSKPAEPSEDTTDLFSTLPIVYPEYASCKQRRQAHLQHRPVYSQSRHKRWLL